MNLREAFKQLQLNILAGNTTMLKSPPGYGKTDLMAKVALWFTGLPQNTNKRIGFSCFFMATQSPIGFTGLPWKSEREFGDGKRWTVTDPAIPQWYMATDLKTGEVQPASMFDHVILVIEEWGQGTPETKRAGAEVLRAGGTPPFYLPPGSPRIALSNHDARDGVTKEYDFVISRRSELEITPDARVWVDDFAVRGYMWDGKYWPVTPFAISWVLQQGNDAILFEPKPAKQGPWCNPRTYTAADRYVQVASQANGGKPPVKESTFIESIAGTIGMPAAAKYVGDMEFTLTLPSYEDVVKDPENTPVPNKADLQMLMAYELAGKAQAQDLSPVIQYMTKAGSPRMPQDMSITFVSALLRRDYKQMMAEPAMKTWIAKNANLVSIIATLQ